MKKELFKGNEALGEAAVRAGCRYYFGYPITPQNEIPVYMSKRLPEVGGVFVQAESEVASINMVYGAAACGVMAMTTSSSPGVSLMQEGISYIAGSEVPAVIVNMMRGGPGLGNIAPSQADYLQAVKGGGHGDYHLIVLAPHTVQEIVDLTYKSFDLAFKYRNCVMILADGALGQMSEPVVLPPMKDPNIKTDWSLLSGKEKIIIRSMRLNPENELETLNHKLQRKYEQIKKDYVEFEEYQTKDADYVFVAYGTPARVCRSVVDDLRSEGVKIGLFRPISVWPFPVSQLRDLAERMSKNPKSKIMVTEMAHDQLEQDVNLSVNGKVKVIGLNKLGGALFTEEELLSDARKLVKE